ncbi:MAG: flagellar assembly protein FliH, partial [Firmicutes bacterium]|nr:flagellar assembly protein FliH [Bacillota bacterium]
MSKVLKSVVFESDKPLLLKEHSTASQKNGRMLNNGSLLNKVKHTHQKIYEDAGKRLLEEALVKTREIIEKSKKEAQELISKAEAKKQQIEKEAFSKGYENGMKTAIEQQEVLWNERIKELEKTQKDLKKKNTIFRKNLEEECLKLSLAIAEKILGSTIQADNNLFLNLIRKSMERASEE